MSTTTHAPRLNAIPVYYVPEGVCPPQGGSPSPQKPIHVVASWERRNYPIEVRRYEPLSRDQLAIAHDRSYVDKVLDLERPNGFDTVEQEVADALPYTNASFLEAAREALKNGLVACSPTSGFHHARWASGGGFCTFNGLMIAARTLLQAQAVERIGILDCDAHYGNGTDDILRKMPKDEAARLEHYTRTSPHYGEADSTTPGEFLAHLPVLLGGWKQRGVGLVLYQAGADPHIDDPMGGAFLTNAELRARDAVVFETCRRLGMPVVWNLAGGYQEDRSLRRGSAGSIRKVLDIHDATMEECVRVYINADLSNGTSSVGRAV